jgi:hypothetical protein
MSPNSVSRKSSLSTEALNSASGANHWLCSIICAAVAPMGREMTQLRTDVIALVVRVSCVRRLLKTDDLSLT